MEEIEIKLLMSGFPQSVEPFYQADVNQFYLCVSPEIRMREKIDKDCATYKQTIKSTGDLIRTEIEFDVSKDIYLKSLGLISKTPIHKDYKKYKLQNGLILEVSFVDGTFYYGEIEFSNIEDAKHWVVPNEIGEYIIKNVTYDASYKMKNYWNNTRNLKGDLNV